MGNLVHFSSDMTGKELDPLQIISLDAEHK